MSLSIEVVSNVLLSLIIVTGILICLIFANKFILKYNKIAFLYTKQYLVYRYFEQDEIQTKCSKKHLLLAFVSLVEQIDLDDAIKQKIIDDLHKRGIFKKYYKEVSSMFVSKRKRAIFYLSYTMNKNIVKQLMDRLSCEKNESVKLYIAYACKHHLDEPFVRKLMETLPNASKLYRLRISNLVNQYLDANNYFITTLVDTPHLEVKECLVRYAMNHKHQVLNQFLRDELNRVEHYISKVKGFEDYINEDVIDIVEYQTSIIKTLFVIYEDRTIIEAYKKSSNESIQHVIIDYYAKQETIEGMKQILLSANGSIVDDYRKEVVTSLTDLNPDLFIELIELFHTTKEDNVRVLIASILAFRSDYLILKLTTKKKQLYLKTIKSIVEYGFVAEIIRFLNQNKNKFIEEELVNTIQPVLLVNEALQLEFRQYLDQHILEKIGFTKKDIKTLSPNITKLERRKIRWLTRILIVSIVFFPIIYVLRYYNSLFSTNITLLLIRYVVDINYYLVFYYIIVNLIYFILIILSLKGSRQQSFDWNMKSKTMMFERGMLSSISIIAPAYNEELSIVDSINSLLNLHYPNYEVIVVNDGSKDGTMSQLVSAFELERKNITIHSKIPTKHIRGVYKNKHIPNLTVIDKENGGKADALNVGINMARYDYICGIDADSMLESESLLRLMSVTIDAKEKIIALGGNIYPANGCKIDRGVVEEKGLPSNMLARLQSIEYLRAFTSGRIGWAKLKTLLIVSGAFGLFEKTMLIEAGGYLTVSGVFKKHTVGEDMELVVRLARTALEKKMNHRIDYVYHANCFTEVPTDMKSLLKQRNRWHRGLIDILSYHRKLIFHPSYKQVGMIGLPYFTIFEMIGPLFEVQGYLMLFLALAFGLLNVPILLAIFTSTIMLGIVISLLSLWVTERDSQYLGIKDTLLLVIYAILENLGYRQLISLYRVVGFFASLRETGTWGAMVRKGFKK